MSVGGVRRTFGNVALRINSELSWPARSGRPFPGGLPCFWSEATTELAPHLPESAWVTRAARQDDPAGGGGEGVEPGCNVAGYPFEF